MEFEVYGRSVEEECRLGGVEFDCLRVVREGEGVVTRLERRVALPENEGR